ncbi:MAG: methyltransferase domain-containing protein [Myxococcales bacterium]|nr:methyltransferase domain-containing protein [Myxococcales bacterium]
MLVDALRGEAILRLAPGLRVLDLGHGSPEIARWVEEVAQSLDRVESGELAREDGEIELEFPAESFDLTYCLGTIAHLGHDEASSDVAVRALLAEAERVTTPGGIVIVEIDNPRSLRGAAHGIRHPITVVAKGGIVLSQGRRVDRYDTEARLASFAPDTLDIVDLHGIRVFIAVPETLAIPIIGRLLARLEWRARDSEFLRRFGAHQLVVMRKRAAPFGLGLSSARLVAASESMVAPRRRRKS